MTSYYKDDNKEPAAHDKKIYLWYGVEPNEIIANSSQIEQNYK